MQQFSGYKSVLIYNNTQLWESQYIPALELILRFSELGIQVTYLYCRGNLKSCPANPRHTENICHMCRSTSDRAIKSLLPESTKIEVLANSLVYDVPSFDSQKEFIDYTYEDLPAGKLAYSQMVDDISDLSLSLAEINSRGRNLIWEAINLYIQTIKIINQESIDCVFSWNGRRSSDGPVLFAARKLHLKSYAYSSGSSPDKYFFQENSLHSVKEWSESIRNFSTKYVNKISDLERDAEVFFTHQQSNKRITFDHTYFAAQFAENFDFQRKTKKPHLVIFTSSSWESINFIEIDDLHPDFKNTYRLIDQILNNSVIANKYEISVRWHPNLQNAGKAETAQIKKIVKSTKGINHFLPESNLNSYGLLKSADVVLTTGSTMGLEANYYKIPSILVGVALYQYLETCHQPANFSELVKLLNSDLIPMNQYGSYLYGAFFANYGEPYRSFSFRKGRYFYGGKSIGQILNPSKKISTLMRDLRKLLN
jgi:hypothetical protein